MLKFPCLVLDHDDTVVQSEATVNYPFFCYILNEFRPGSKITLQEYTDGCFGLGFSEMCRQLYGFSDRELEEEYRSWQQYIRNHTPDPFDGIERIIRRQKEEGGMLCVVSHSCEENITRDYATHFGILPDAIYGWDYPEAQRKPYPFPLNDIMQRFGFQKHEILVVDDMKPAYEMASKVGVPIAFAAWSRTNCPELSEEMSRICDYTFSTTKALESFLFDEA